MLFLSVLLSSAVAQPQELPRGFELRQIPVGWSDRPGDRPEDVIAFSADSMLVAVADDNTARVWGTADGVEKTRVHLPVSSWRTHLAFPPDGKTLVTAGGEDTAVRWFDLSTGKQVRERPFATGDKRFSPDHARVVRLAPSGDWYLGYEVVGDTAQAVVCETASGERRAIIQDHPRFTFQHALVVGERPRVIGAAYTSDAVARVWDANTGRLVRGLGGSTVGRGWLNQVLLAASADGRLVAGNMATRGGLAVSRHRTEIWRVDDGRLVAALPDVASSLTFAANGRIVVVVTDTKVRVFDLLKEAYIQDFLIPGPMQHQVGSRDGKTLAVVGWHHGGAQGGELQVGPFPSLPEPLPAAGELTGDRLTEALAMLSSTNEFRGRYAIRAFAARPDQAVDVLGAKLTPDPDRRRAAVTDLIKTLNDDSPDTRDKALAELVPYCHRFEPLVTAAHKAAPPGEVRNRLATALAAVRDGQPPADLLKDLRSVEVLEVVKTPAAKDLLTKLAAGAADSRLTAEANAALGRLKKQ